MTETATHQGNASSARELLKQLQQTFKVISDCMPLAIGIDKQLIANDPAINRKLLRSALGMHTRSVRYLKALQHSNQRFNLDGSVSGETSEEQRALASKELTERFKKRAAEHKAAQAEKIRLEKQAQAEQERLEKLNLLASKFSRK